ncbi:unnamed protein product, partial [Linum tenue]
MHSSRNEGYLSNLVIGNRGRNSKKRKPAMHRETNALRHIQILSSNSAVQL